MLSNVRFAAVAAGLMATLFNIPCGLASQLFALETTKGLQPYDVTVNAMTYQGRKAVRVLPLAADAAPKAAKSASGGGIVVLPGAAFHNGTIEVEVSGKPGAGAAR